MSALGLYLLLAIGYVLLIGPVLLLIWLLLTLWRGSDKRSKSKKRY